MRNRKLTIIPWTKANKDKVYLTEKQTQVLRGIGQGKTIKEIAFELNTAPNTVGGHATILMKKFMPQREHPLASIARQVFGKEK